MAITITVKGVDLTNYIDYKSIAIADTMEVTGDTLSFNLYSPDSTVKPECGNEVILTDGSTKEFGGIITKVAREKYEGDVVQYNCSAIDYTYMLDRRYVNKIYDSKAVSDGSNDSMLEDILFDLKQAADSDSVTGDSFYTDFYNNLSSAYVSIGPNVRQQVFQRTLPSQAISNLAESTGMVWWIDFDKRVNFKQSTEMWATFLPTVDGYDGIDVSQDIENYWDLNMDDSIESIGTKAIIQDAIIQSTSSQVDRFDINATQATNGAKLNLTHRPYNEYSIGSVVRIRSGVSLVLEPQQLDHVTRDATDYSASAVGATFYPFINVGRQGQNDSYVRLSPDAIQQNDQIVVTYQYSTTDEHENIDIDQVDAHADATGGDGIHEFIFSRGSEIAVTDVVDLDEIAQVLLDRKSKTLRRGSFDSFTKGWKAGQMFYLKWDREGITETMWVINVNKTLLTPADDPSLSDNVILTNVQFSNIPRGLKL